MIAKELGGASIPLVGGILVAVTAISVWTLTRPPVEKPAEPGQQELQIESSIATETTAADNVAAEASTTTRNAVSIDSAEPTVEVTTQSAVTAKSADVDGEKETSQSLSPSPEGTDSAEAGLSQDELAEIGTAAYSDGEFELLKQLIQDQPLILTQLLEEFRANSDPDRAARLAELLGQFDEQSITDIGAEMAFSGDPVSQQAGLDLLGRQQQRSSNARGVITQVLEVESNPDVLVPALNAISRSSRVEADEQQNILNQLSNLSIHDDPRVRSHSFALIKGWSKNVNMNAVLLQGLEDSDERVRESATFSLVNTEFPTEEVKFALLSRLEDETEKKSIREGSFNALRRFQLSLDEQARLDAALKLLNQ